MKHLFIKIVTLLSVVGPLLTSCSSQEDLNTRIAKINDIGKLQVLEYEMNWIVNNEGGDQNLLEQAKDKFGDRFILYSGNVKLTASVDLSNFSRDNVEADQESNSLTITLPRITKDDLTIDIDENNIHKVYERVDLVRSNFSNEEKELLRKKAEDEIYAKLDKTDIIPEAEANAKEALKLLFKPVGYDVTVKFEDETVKSKGDEEK